MKLSIIVPSVLWMVAINGVCAAQSPSQVREYRKAFTTYPFSDPDPVPSQSAIYPYYRFDGFTDNPVQKEWKVVELENDYIRVMILPEIGGKIWTAIEKSTGKPFIYYNQVVKFRDVAMRGPWTSGGLEPNYGIIGHTPNCATPVDYLTRQNADKSVSCFIGTFDLLTRSWWQIEIRLPFDRACFSTRSFWYNPNPLEQPYYHWMNTGIPVKGSLEFVFPGTHYIGHEGEFASWPVNQKNGKKISFYEENNFGGYKSYHVFGKYTDFFGAYWHDEDFGMARYAPHEDKIGKKIWIWGLSRQGMIWEKLLTDENGQYAEIQSGRLFNQNAEQSSFTPFKHRGFAPHGSDEWTEYWYPVLNTKGISVAGQDAAMNLDCSGNMLKIYVSPVGFLKDTLVIRDNNREIYRKAVHLEPLRLFADSVSVEVKPVNLRAELVKSHLQWSGDPRSGDLARPVSGPADFDLNSAYGLYLQGKELMDQKLFSRAGDKLAASLQKDPWFIPALTKMAEWQYRNTNYKEAFELAQKALSIDTHDGAANYYYGLAAHALHDTINARDGFDVACLSEDYRAAAFTELGRMDLEAGNWEKANWHAGRALDYNNSNMEALEIRTISLRRLNRKEEAGELIKKILALHPLDLFARMEIRFLNPGGAEIKAEEAGWGEMQAESLLELAAGYSAKGMQEEAMVILKQLPDHPLALYRLAWMQVRQGNSWIYLLNRADSLSPLLVFPFRSEDREVLEWASGISRSWKPRYYLGLLMKEKCQPRLTRQWFSEIGNVPDFAPFYASRAQLFWDDSARVEKDLNKALGLDPGSWRYRKMLTLFYNQHANYRMGLNFLEAFYREHPDNYIIGMELAKSFLLNRRYADCDQLLEKIRIIPFEGATEGRELYREAKLMLSIAEMRKKNFRLALKMIEAAKIWPENLGVGKPYDSDIDTRLEDWMRYQCLLNMKQPKEASGVIRQILAFNPGVDNTVRNFLPAAHLVTAWALEISGRGMEALPWLDSQIARYPGLKQILWAKDIFLDKKSVLNMHQDPTARILEAILE